MTRLTDDQLQSLLAGCEGVTPGPWAVEQTGIGMADMFIRAGKKVIAIVAPQKFDENAEYLAEMPPEVRASLITELMELRRAFETLPMTVYSVEEDEGTIRLSVCGQQIAAWGDGTLEGIALLKLASALNPKAPK